MGFFYSQSALNCLDTLVKIASAIVFLIVPDRKFGYTPLANFIV